MEDRATSTATISRRMSKKNQKEIFKQQNKLTAIQYCVTLFIFIIGIIVYNVFDTFCIHIGSINLNDTKIQDVTINIGTILILTSIYMCAKITIMLNIHIKD